MFRTLADAGVKHRDDLHLGDPDHEIIAEGALETPRARIDAFELERPETIEAAAAG